MALANITGRFAALALLIVPIALVILGVATPYLQWRSAVQADIIAGRDQLGRYEAIIEEARRVDKSNPGDQSKHGASSLLPGSTDSARTAGLQARLSDLGRAKGIRFESARGLPTRDRINIRLVGVEARFSSGIDELQNFLLGIEDSEALLVVEALQITVPNSGGGRAARDGRLEIQLNVLGVADTNGEARP